MIGHFSSSTSSKLQQSCAFFFKKRGWNITVMTSDPSDLLIEKGPFLKYNIECVDHSILGFKSLAQIADTLEDHVHRIKTWIPLFFVTNFEFPLAFHGAARKRQVITFSVEDLEAVAALPQLMSDLDGRISDSQRALLELNTWACLEFAKLHYAAGNNAESLAWAKRAIKPSDSVGGAHHVVFSMLLKAKQIDDAYLLAKEAVLRRRDDVFLLRGLLQIVTTRGSASEMEHYSQLIKEAGGDRPRSIDKLLRAPQQAKPTDAPVDPRQPKPHRLALFRKH